jgi:hypothetical protein
MAISAAVVFLACFTALSGPVDDVNDVVDVKDVGEVDAVDDDDIGDDIGDIDDGGDGGDGGDDGGGAFRVWPGVGVGHQVVGGVTVAPQIAFSIPLLGFVEPEVMVGLGLHASPRVQEVTNRFSFGMRWFVPEAVAEGVGAFDVSSPVRPFLWTAIHHGHAVAVTDVVKNPIGALLTSSAAGVGHLTGLESGVGALLAVAVDGASWPILVRGGASWLPALASVHAYSAGAGGDDTVLITFDIAVGLPMRINDRP